MHPIDLKNVSAGRFKLSLDPAADREPSGKKDPWYQAIPCKHGQVYPYSDALLAVHVKGYAARRKLADIDGPIQYNWSDDGEAVFLFPPALFEQVAEIIRPKRKRRLGEAQRRAAADRLRAYHFRPNSTHVNTEKRAENKPIPVRPMVGAK